ncbi:MAG: NUDIX hydrolase N-terminal domain-containing protein [Anaerolineales bacterium]
MMKDGEKIPQWLIWARKIDALAQAGLHYSQSEYDLDRYRQLKSLAAEIVAAYSQFENEEVLDHFVLEEGYSTPKVDVRAAVVEDGKLLMVRERLDDGWTLPGGWVDVGDRPASAAEREAQEESGYQVKAVRLVGVYDANRVGELRYHHAFKLIFLCELVGGEAAASYETSEVGWFDRDALPQPFSDERTKARHIEDIFAAAADPTCPTVFD